MDIPDPVSARVQLDEAIGRLSEKCGEAVERWICVRAQEVLDAWILAGGDLSQSHAVVRAALSEAAEVSAARAVVCIESLRGRDPALPGTPGPLEALQDLSHYPTRVLADAGVGEVNRDPFEELHFPEDVYGLRVCSFRDLPGGEDLVDLHIFWGVAKTAVLRVERGTLFE